jgi:STE24 endopeptidase
VIAEFILVALIGYYLLDSAAKFLNLRNLSVALPPEFGDVYDEFRYRRSQDYTRTQTWFEILVSSLSLALLLTFWFLGGFEALDRWVRSFQLGPIVSGLIYLAVLGIAHEVLSLPLDVYRTFVIEQKYGFNRTKVRTFVVDRLRDWTIASCLAIALVGMILALFQWMGLGAWMVAWAFTALAAILLQYLAPRLILPLYFKFTPVPSGELRDRITDFCERQRFPLQDLLVIDGSRRSAKANAFFTGFGTNKKIALYDTLINNHSVSELIAVLAHEIGHFKKSHIIKHFLFGLFSLLIFFFAASLCVSRPELFATFGVEKPSYYVGLALFLILVRPLAILLGIVGNFWSRQHEYEADRFAAESLGDPSPLVAALKKLSKDNLSNLTPHPLLVGLHFSHPPVLKRIHALLSRDQTA